MTDWNERHNNTRQWFIWGISRYATDEKYGGGKEKTIEVFDEAIELFELYPQMSPIYHSWRSDEVYGFLARVYYELKQYSRAKQCLDMTLKINPSHKMLNHILKPKIEYKLLNKYLHKKNLHLIKLCLNNKKNE